MSSSSVIDCGDWEVTFNGERAGLLLVTAGEFGFAKHEMFTGFSTEAIFAVKSESKGKSSITSGAGLPGRTAGLGGFPDFFNSSDLDAEAL